MISIVQNFRTIAFILNIISQYLADISFGLLQVFVELGILHRTSNRVVYLIYSGRLFWFS